MGVASNTIERVKVFGTEDMDDGEIHHIAGGVAAVYSRGSPEKTASNEDGATVIPAGAGRCVLAVADGLGGQPAGEQASRLALAALAHAVQEAASHHGDLRSAILDGFEGANDAVSSLGVGAATTLAAVEIEAGRVRPYHVGDSMIVVVGQRGRTKLQTISHSPVGYAVEAGWLEAADALHHEDRHLVSNMVGSPEMRIEIGPVRHLCPRDTVVLASDGLFDNLHLEEIIHTIRKGPLMQVVHDLAEHCDERMRTPEAGHPSKPDDLTFILFRLQDSSR